jgi:hypothetical protein
VAARDLGLGAWVVAVGCVCASCVVLSPWPRFSHWWSAGGRRCGVRLAARTKTRTRPCAGPKPKPVLGSAPRLDQGLTLGRTRAQESAAKPRFRHTKAKSLQCPGGPPCGGGSSSCAGDAAACRMADHRSWRSTPVFLFFWEGLSLQAKQRSAPPKKPRACRSQAPFKGPVFIFWEGLSLQAKQRSAPPQKPRACLSQAPTKRGVCASLPAALLPDTVPMEGIPIG